MPVPSIFAWLPIAGPIRVSTVLAALAVFAIVLWRKRSPLLAIVAVIVWASAFELIYNGIGTALFGWPLSQLAWNLAALAGWILLAAVLGVWPDRWALLGFLILMVGWVLTGFHSNVPGSSARFDVLDEAFNEASKSMLALAYLIGALRAPRAPARWKKSAELGSVGPGGLDPPTTRL
jgi:hypothetical protein